MEESRHETVSDIVAEMRQEAFDRSADASCAIECAILRHYSDRIEAAAMREREAGAEAAQICGEIGEMVGREAAVKSSQVGNAAVMRKALSDSSYAMFNFLKTQNGGWEEMANALDKAKAALADPPRNCDVGTVDEQIKRHRDWCNIDVCYESSCKICFAKWSQMSYEKGGAK